MDNGRPVGARRSEVFPFCNWTLGGGVQLNRPESRARRAIRDPG